MLLNGEVWLLWWLGIRSIVFTVVAMMVAVLVDSLGNRIKVCGSVVNFL